MNATANRYYTATPYKGFVILQDNADSRCYVTADSGLDASQAPIVADGFRLDGYGTINTAKGAITKHNTARDAAHDKGMEALAADWAKQDAQQGRAPAPTSKAATLDDSERASVAADGWTKQRTPNGDPIHSNPEMAYVYAQMDYHGMNRERDTRSRNKREGVYNGYTDGRHERATCRNGGSRVLFSRTSKYYTPTRKHRKAARLAMKGG